ncbi:MAG: DNA topoisomerase (ATP-hydrolyzing) [Lachnospiraceae bacterium]|nr:DNA topoisomerase (ATP-hydrolyzing) [Lachnospiraceae bacterium]
MSSVVTHDRIIRTDYSEIMQKNYIDYAMSVIVARALPDVRDGLKPVQRRVLYDMYELGTRYDRPYRKCARIVGDTMGKFHPHGDSSIYDALVVMAQDFKKGRTLVDGHGNFGSIEGDGAAAMRYTEARLEKFTQDVFLSDLDKNVIPFMPNFDETEKEPEVLPARLPNILINGSDGIAVGMATSIPPHNLTEVIEAVEAYIKDPTLSTEDLMKYIKGPDFPTGGIVVNKDDLKEIYETGTGKIRVRGRVVLESGKNGKMNIVVTEIPYTMIGAGIGKFMADCAALAENKTCPEIVDISNQSSKEGIRIVIECRKGADVANIRNILFKKTKLEDTFGVNMLVVSRGRPETMSLKGLLASHVDFQFETATKKYQYLLAREEEQREIQEGLIRAVDVIDLIIEILRGSKNRKMAMDCLVSGKTEGIHFKSDTSRRAARKLLFTEKQANAILDMRLVKLIGLEIDALNAQHAETMKKIAHYRELLDNKNLLAADIITDLEKLRKEYGVDRRTSIENAREIVIEEKAPEEEEVVFCLDRFGYAKLLDTSTYEKNQEAADKENVYRIRVMNTDRVAVFTNAGKLHYLKVMDVPRKKLREKGVPLDNLTRYSAQDEDILCVTSESELAQGSVFFATKAGLVKVTPGSEFVSVSRGTIQSTKLQDGDELLFVSLTGDMNQVVLRTEEGCFLKFPLKEVSELKKTAAGVRGIALQGEDTVKECWLLDSSKEFEIIYHDQSLSLTRMRVARRGGKGTKKK